MPWVDEPATVDHDFIHDTDELAMPVKGEEEFKAPGKKYRPGCSRSSGKPGDRFALACP